MKKGFCLVVLTIFLLSVNMMVGVAGETITGEVITGDATQGVGMSIFVTAHSLTLTILSPRDETYLSNEFLLLDYLASDAQVVWYNLDNSVNITITSFVYFNASQGDHVLYLYANNSLGNITSKNVSFFIDSNLPVVVDDEPASFGGGKREIIRDFRLEEKITIISLKIGEVVRKEIVVSNVGNSDLKIRVESLGLRGFIKIKEARFDLKIGESKIIILDFMAGEDILPGLYLGKVVVKSSGVKREVIIAVEVESEDPPFDVEAEMSSQFLNVMAGGKVVSKIILYNLRGAEKTNVTVEYVIKDEEGNDIVDGHGTLSIGAQEDFIKVFQLPENIEPGNYIYYVRVSHSGEVASSSYWFSVASTEEEFPLSNKESFLIAAAVILVIIILFMLYRSKKLRKFF